MRRTGRLMVADMTRCANFALLLLVALLTACSKAPDGQVAQSVTKAIDYDRNVGWLHGNCLAIMNSGLPVGTPLTVVQPDHPQRLSSATVAGNANSGETCKALLEDRRKVNADSGYTFYRVDVKSEINLGIAMLGTGNRIEDYGFSYCSTTEGIAFTLKALPKDGGAALWRGYYYLGYDTEPNCPDPS